MLRRHQVGEHEQMARNACEQLTMEPSMPGSTSHSA